MQLQKRGDKRVTDMEADKVKKNTGKTIRKIRTAREETLEEFSEKAYVSVGREGDIEKEGTLNISIMHKYAELSGKSLLFFILDVLPDDEKERQLSLFLAELDDTRLAKQIEWEKQNEEKENDKKELCRKADTYAEKITGYRKLSAEDLRYVKKIISVLYQHTYLSLKETPLYTRTGRPVIDSDKEWVRQMLDTAEDLVRMTERAEDRSDMDVFGWFDMQFMAYTFPYIKELQALPGIYKKRLTAAVAYLLRQYMNDCFPGRKRHRTANAAVLKALKDTSSEAYCNNNDMHREDNNYEGNQHKETESFGKDTTDEK